MNNVAVIDYNAGNTGSVIKALDFLGMNVVLTRDRETLLNSDRVILPGVGAFNDSLETLRKYSLTDVIGEIKKEGIPFLGICLGMQVLFGSSEETIGSDTEGDRIQGLNLLPGEILKFKNTNELKVPHMGWNSLDINRSSRLFHNIDNGTYFYFVHSYYLNSFDRDIVAATCNYATTFDAAIESGNFYACQFHPEKSGEAGLNLLKNFCNIH